MTSRAAARRVRLLSIPRRPASRTHLARARGRALHSENGVTEAQMNDEIIEMMRLGDAANERLGVVLRALL
jgi:hypothetical protein